LRVQVDSPALEWSLTASETAILRSLNGITAHLPMWTWRPRVLLRTRERIAARMLRMGELVDRRADGVDLGRPTQMTPNPTIGHVPLPARGVLAIGQAICTSPTPAQASAAT
jgi:hypothetical protein